MLSILKHYHLHLIVLVIVGTSLISPEPFTHAVQQGNDLFKQQFDWLLLLLFSLCIVACLYLAMSRFGQIRLGRQDEQPEYATASWLAMLFAAGMGSGLVFWGAAEPLYHFHRPPPSLEGVDAASLARQAFVITLFHWGIHAWAIYALCALTIAYFSYRHGWPMLPSSPILAMVTTPEAPLTPIQRMVKLLVDGIAVLAVIFGVIGSLGQGVLQMSGGVNALWFSGGGDVQSLFPWLMGVLTLAFMLSASTGLRHGIKWLSDLNILLSILLMACILCWGPTLFMLRTAVGAIGDYLSQLIELSFNMRHLDGGGEWMRSWTLNLLLWWVAWGPFVGVFIARISRGRTIRQFMLGVVLVPTFFSLVWFSIMGGAAMHQALHGNAMLATLAVNDAYQVTYTLLGGLPWATWLQTLILILIFIFLVTSADSGTYVLAMFSSHGQARPPVLARLFWGTLLAILAYTTLQVAATGMLMRAVAASGGIPFLAVLLVQFIALSRALKKEHIPLDAVHKRGDSVDD